MIPSNYFSPVRLSCSHCGKEGVLPDALALLNALRILVGKPITCTSGYRCKDHPIEAAKATPGQHNVGHAFDLRHGGDEELKNGIIEAAEKLGFNGIGIHKSFVHVDLRSKRARWGY